MDFNPIQGGLFFNLFRAGGGAYGPGFLAYQIGHFKYFCQDFYHHSSMYYVTILKKN